MFYSDHDMAIRCCRTPDRRRTVAIWALYYDTFKKIPNKGWLPPITPTPLPYEIRTFKAKGRGMVAVRDIKLGEVIINERPILMMPFRMPRFNPLNPWRDTEEIPLQMLYQLEQEDREKVVRLHNCKSLDNYGPLGGIFMTNALSFSVPDSRVCTEYAAICLTISNINHACLPNAAYEPDTEAVVFTIRAKRNIAKGEEITLGYIQDEGLSTAGRRDLLQRKYSFMCSCKLCSAGVMSDERRKFIRTTVQSIDSMFDKFNELGLDRAARTSEAKRLSKMVEKLLQAMDEEGLHTGRKKSIELCIAMYAILGDTKTFRKWVNRALDSEATKGRNASLETVKELDGMLDDPNSYLLWDSLAAGLVERTTSNNIRV
ncbi:hypothetical protein ACEPAG_4705 [Sanghuangporus baumii]